MARASNEGYWGVAKRGLEKLNKQDIYSARATKSIGWLIVMFFGLAIVSWLPLYTRVLKVVEIRTLDIPQWKQQFGYSILLVCGTLYATFWIAASSTRIRSVAIKGLFVGVAFTLCAVPNHRPTAHPSYVTPLMNLLDAPEYLSLFALPMVIFSMVLFVVLRIGGGKFYYRNIGSNSIPNNALDYIFAIACVAFLVPIYFLGSVYFPTMFDRGAVEAGALSLVGLGLFSLSTFPFIVPVAFQSNSIHKTSLGLLQGVFFCTASGFIIDSVFKIRPSVSLTDKAAFLFSLSATVVVISCILLKLLDLFGLTYFKQQKVEAFAQHTRVSNLQVHPSLKSCFWLTSLILTLILLIFTSYFAIDLWEIRQANFRRTAGIQRVAGKGVVEFSDADWFDGSRTVVEANLGTGKDDHALISLDVFLDDLRVLDLDDSKVTDEGLRRLNSAAYLTKLHFLSVENTQVSDSGLLNLETPHLSCINLRGSKITFDGLIRKFQNNQLVHLFADGLGIDDEQFRTLATNSLGNWNSLSLANCDLTDETLPLLFGESRHYLSLRANENLKFQSVDRISAAIRQRISILDLESTGVSDASLTLLQRLSVDSLDLSNTKITDAAVRSLEGFVSEALYLNECDINGSCFDEWYSHELDVLSLEKTNVNDQGMNAIQKFSKLTYLNLANTKISDASLHVIAKLSKAAHDREFKVDLSHTEVTKAGILRNPAANAGHILILGRNQFSEADFQDLRRNGVFHIRASRNEN